MVRSYADGATVPMLGGWSLPVGRGAVVACLRDRGAEAGEPPALGHAFIHARPGCAQEPVGHRLRSVVGGLWGQGGAMGSRYLLRDQGSFIGPWLRA
jgi:hypothetical protein